MPTYKYKCNECKHTFEEYAKIADRLDVKCEKCGGLCNIMLYPTSFHMFVPFDHPNLGPKPVHIKSRQHLKEEAKKRNMTAYY